MAVSQDFIAYVQELLAPAGVIRVKRMFGAAGVYVDELFFALIDDDALYFRTDEESEAAFREAGSAPFVYQTGDGQQMQMAFWRAPAEAMEGADEAAPWVRLGIEAALRKKAKKRPRKPKV